MGTTKRGTKVTLSILFLLFLSQTIYAAFVENLTEKDDYIDHRNKVIYGSDDRVNVAGSKNINFKKLARSTSAMIPKAALSSEFDGLLVSINARKLQDTMNVCKDEAYSQQASVAMCSGFLVGEDLLVTAGHCIRSDLDCKNNRWIFDYRQDLLGRVGKVYFNSNNVYGCKEIISSDLSNATKNDYALIRLNRKVVGRKPLKYRKEGKIELGKELVVIGHPSGLPTIVADGAKVRKNRNYYFFQGNLDTFGGNSGSAVFDKETGVVEGILVRGERDYTYDWVKKCARPYRIGNEAGRGEDVTRITAVPINTKDGSPNLKAPNGKDGEGYWIYTPPAPPAPTGTASPTETATPTPTPQPTPELPEIDDMDLEEDIIADLDDDVEIEGLEEVQFSRK